MYDRMSGTDVYMRDHVSHELLYAVQSYVEPQLTVIVTHEGWARACT